MELQQTTRSHTERFQWILSCKKCFQSFPEASAAWQSSTRKHLHFQTVTLKLTVEKTKVLFELLENEHGSSQLIKLL